MSRKALAAWGVRHEQNNFAKGGVMRFVFFFLLVCCFGIKMHAELPVAHYQMSLVDEKAKSVNLSYLSLEQKKRLVNVLVSAYSPQPTFLPKVPHKSWQIKRLLAALLVGALVAGVCILGYQLYHARLEGAQNALRQLDVALVDTGVRNSDAQLMQAEPDPIAALRRLLPDDQDAIHALLQASSQFRQAQALLAARQIPPDVDRRLAAIGSFADYFTSAREVVGRVIPDLHERHLQLPLPQIMPQQQPAGIYSLVNQLPEPPRGVPQQYQHPALARQAQRVERIAIRS
jgi:hypothetical protein